MIHIPLAFSITAVLIFIGILASRLSTVLQIPVLLMFLAIGMLAGEEGLGGLPFEDYAFAGDLGTLALAFILFSGAYDTSWGSVRKVLFRGTLLSTLGVLLTAIGTGVFVAWLMEWPLGFGLLLGAIVSSTDAAAVFAIFRSRDVGLKGDLRPMLELESGSNDPMAALLTIFMIQFLNEPNASFTMFFPYLVTKIGVGTLIGWIVGVGTVRFINKIRLEYDGLYYVVGIGTVLLAFGLSEMTGGNGFMAVFVCGLYMGNSRFLYRNGLGRFHDGIAWLMQVVLFLALGLLVTPSQILLTWREGTLIALALMFLVRPLCVAVCLLGSSFHWREQVLLAWGGIRGAAPIVLAIFPCYLFQDPTCDAYAKTIFHMVFYIVLLSVLIQGKTLMPLARFLHLDEAGNTKPRPPLEFEETGRSKSRMYEYEISPFSLVAGKALRDIGLPSGALIYLIRRGATFIVPTGGTIIQSGDELLMMLEPKMADAVEKIIHG
ncbi:MAG: potassium/proton antiporter [Planctomycetia bacterium]|nr:potassium/proton antiporter [Planctomycetia bacterium]